MPLPKGWEKISLDAVCLKRPLVDPRKNPREEFDYVDIAAVSNLKFRIETTKRYCGGEAPSRARKPIFAGDVIFATTRPYLRSVARVPEHLNGQICSTGFCVLRPSHRVTSEWL